MTACLGQILIFDPLYSPYLILIHSLHFNSVSHLCDFGRGFQALICTGMFWGSECTGIDQLRAFVCDVRQGLFRLSTLSRTDHN